MTMMKVLVVAALLTLCAARSSLRRSDESVRQARKIAFEETIVDNVLKHAPRHAKLLSFRSAGPVSTQTLQASLTDNATLIREDIVGGFDCGGRVYGYYADPLNDCQIFHLCVNLKQIFPDHFDVEDIMHFSFICPKYTIFTQDAMVCAWERSAIPCEVAPQLYYMNNNFFVIPPTDVQKIAVTEVPTPEITPP